MDTEKVKQNPAVEAAGSSGGQAARIFKKENIPKTAETVGRDTFEEWMGRIMERFDRQDRIISVLVNKDAAGVKYLDGERLYDNQDLCEMLRQANGRCNASEASTGSVTNGLVTRPITRNRTCWSSSAKIWRKCCKAVPRCSA